MCATPGHKSTLLARKMVPVRKTLSFFSKIVKAQNINGLSPEDYNASITKVNRLRITALSPSVESRSILVWI